MLAQRKQLQIQLLVVAFTGIPSRANTKKLSAVILYVFYGLVSFSSIFLLFAFFCFVFYCYPLMLNEFRLKTVATAIVF